MSAEDFLRYLEQHEVTPCTELVSQIRALRKKRARKERILKERRNKLKAINRGNAHPTLSRQGSNQDLADGSETAPSSSYSRRHSRANIGVMSRQGSKSSLARLAVNWYTYALSRLITRLFCIAEMTETLAQR